MQKDDSARIGPTTAPLPPLVPGLPLLGNALELARAPVRSLVKWHLQYGPIFRVRLRGTDITVLGGLAANEFAQRYGHLVLTNARSFQDLTAELESPINMAVLEGEPHKRVRKIASRGYSRDAMLAAIPDVAKLLASFVRTLGIGHSFDVFPTMQQLISLQLGAAVTNTDATAAIGDLHRFMRYLLNVLFTRAWPRFLLRTKAYRSAKAQSHRFVDTIIAEHRKHSSEAKRSADLIDGLLAAHDADPDALPMHAVRSATFGPFLAGQDTVAGTVSFMLYEVLANPDVYARVSADAEALFANGLPGVEQFNSATALRSAVQETMRLHPVAPMMPQHASSEFEFAGHRVRAGDPIFMAQTIPHFLPEYFEQPFEFMLDRPKPRPLSYAPFGVGPHACIGAAMGELQVMTNLALFLHFGRFSIKPAGYRLRTKTLPLAPKGFHLRLDEIREERIYRLEAAALARSRAH